MMKTPTFLYGTAWKENDTERCVLDALHAGFRGIDTANQRKHYFEAGVGNALKKYWTEGGTARTELFLQTKFTYQRGQDHRLPYNPEASYDKQVEQSFQSSLEHLHTDYLDSYVLHGPASAFGLTPDDWEVWGAMETLHHSGKVKSLGVSNVNLGQLRALFEKANVKPTFVQNRCFARMGWDKEVREFCKTNGMTYQGFSLLTANPEVFQDRRFLAITQKHECTPAQAVFNFAIQIGMLPLTGTTNAHHMKEDLETTRFKLTTEEVRTIEGIAI